MSREITARMASVLALGRRLHDVMWRLRVAMESSLWLIAADVENEAHSAAEMLGIAMYEWIRDALYEIAQTKQDTYEPNAL